MGRAEPPSVSSSERPPGQHSRSSAADCEIAATRRAIVASHAHPISFGPRTDTATGADAPEEDARAEARLRDALGASGREVLFDGRTWRTGDRVVQTRNDYEREVFNGDMGRISSITGEGELIVRFAEQDVAYSGGNLSDLRPAFAITVHRSQGAEFPCVVMPVVTQHALMLQRNLLYTGITRARRLVVLVGTWRALRMAVANADPSRRESALRDRLEHRTPGSTLLGDQFELPEEDLGLPELD